MQIKYEFALQPSVDSRVCTVVSVAFQTQLIAPKVATDHMTLSTLSTRCNV